MSPLGAGPALVSAGSVLVTAPSAAAVLGPAAATAVLVVCVAAGARQALVVRRRARTVRRLGASHRRRRNFAAHRVVAAPERLVASIEDADVEIDPGLFLTLWLAATGLSAAAVALVAGPVPASLAAAAVAVAPVVGLQAGRGRRLARMEAGLPAALEAVARSLRSGGSLRQAVEEASTSCRGALRAELAGIARSAGQGVTMVDALDRWAGRAPVPGVRLAVAALSLGVETGGAQARAVDGVASTIRDRLAVAAEVRAQSSQVRASVLVIATAPVAFCAFASATDARTSTFLFRTPLGWAFLTAGLLLDAISLLWMRRLARVPL